jgi:erythronate-4-phosphate dehydrogenase
MKILTDTHIPYLQGIAEQFGEVEYLPGNQFNKETIKDKDVLIVRTVTHFDEEILSGSKVKLICSATIGYDHIDTAYCDAHNIAWRTAPGCNANSVEQYVTASLLYLAEKHQFRLADKIIGIVGVGNVGSKVAVACEELGMRVLLNDPPRAEKEGNGQIFADLETIKHEADIITFHTPLTKTGEYKTHHLADDDFFASLTKKPFIINVARGGVTDNRALKKAIIEEKISGIVLDCWENEPNIDIELLEMAEIATPHIAGYSADGKWMATKMSLENLNNFFGLNIKPIYQEIAVPLFPVINLHEIPVENQLSHAVWHTYNPMVETVDLKSSPEKFSWFRSHYCQWRREFHAYTVVNADPSVEKLLKKLGFLME